GDGADQLAVVLGVVPLPARAGPGEPQAALGAVAQVVAVGIGQGAGDAVLGGAVAGGDAGSGGGLEDSRGRPVDNGEGGSRGGGRLTLLAADEGVQVGGCVTG